MDHILWWLVGACVALTLKEMKWNAQGKGIFVGHFISPVKGCVKKCMTGFRIDSCTIKRGKLVCISVIQCHSSDLTLHTSLLGSSGVAS